MATKIKINSLEFPSSGFRKLRNLNINFAERITLIAGYNGVGKSTILGLLASSSGTEDVSYLSRKFSIDINYIIHLDEKELSNKSLRFPWPKAVYSIETEDSVIEHWKYISITKRPERLRSVPRTHQDSPDKAIAGQDAKIPLPTLYLGMLRALPIGESNEKSVQSIQEDLNQEDRAKLINFINKIIPNTALDSFTTTQSIKNSGKHSVHPAYAHSSKSVSLGQDSLSSIATAVISFHRLKREMKNEYPGGLLIIDELDAGFHPKAQEKLFQTLAASAKELSLQIIATTHSTELITYAFSYAKNVEQYCQSPDKVVYLAGSTSPAVVDWNLEQILSDMRCVYHFPAKSQERTIRHKDVKIYLEDEEAAKFFKGLFSMKTNYKIFHQQKNRKRGHVIPMGVGGSNLIQLPKHDSYFNTVILVVDADTSVPKKAKNVVKLPTSRAGWNPENTIYHYIEELAKGQNGKYATTYRHLLSKYGVSTDKLIDVFLSNEINIKNRESSKKWFNISFGLIKEYDIIRFWAGDHLNEFEAFKKIFYNKLFDL